MRQIYAILVVAGYMTMLLLWEMQKFTAMQKYMMVQLLLIMRRFMIVPKLGEAVQ